MARPTTLGLLCLALIVGSAGASPRRPTHPARVSAPIGISRAPFPRSERRDRRSPSALISRLEPLPRTSRPPPSRRRAIAMERRRRIHVYLPRASRSPARSRAIRAFSTPARSRAA